MGGGVTEQMAGIDWSQSELELLRELWESGLSLADVAKRFPSRSKDSVKTKATRLKLRHSPEQTFQILSDRVKGENNPMFGKPSARRGVVLSEATKDKLRLAAAVGFAAGTRKRLSGSDNPMFGKPSPKRGVKLSNLAIHNLSRKVSLWWETCTEQVKSEHMLKMRKGWSAWVRNRKPNKIECKVAKWISELGFGGDYAEKQMGHYVVDFLVERKVIEVFGDYWHANPIKYASLDLTQRKNFARDKAKVTFLANRNIPLLVLWESDINTRPEHCVSELRRFLCE